MCSKLVSHQGHLIIFNVIVCEFIFDVDKRRIVVVFNGGGGCGVSFETATAGFKQVIDVFVLFVGVFKIIIGVELVS
jgi:hypothetical protein